MKKIHHAIRHSFDFLLLLLIIGIGLGGLLLFRFDPASQIAIVILMSILYIAWGIFHHHHDGNLTASVISEYVAIAALGAFILIIFLLRV